MTGRDRDNEVHLAAVRGAKEGLTTDDHLAEAAARYNYTARSLGGDHFEQAFVWAREERVRAGRKETCAEDRQACMSLGCGVNSWITECPLHGLHPAKLYRRLLAEAVLCEDAGDFVSGLIGLAERFGLTEDGRTLTQRGKDLFE